MATFVFNIIFVGLTVNLILNAEIIPTSKSFSFSIIQMTSWALHHGVCNLPVPLYRP